MVHCTFSGGMGGYTPTKSGVYAPSVTVDSGPIGVITPPANWSYQRVGTTVVVTGTMAMTWSSNGIAVLSFPVPASLTLVASTASGVGSISQVTYAAGPFTETPPYIDSNAGALRITVSNSVGAAMPTRVQFVIAYQTSAP